MIIRNNFFNANQHFVILNFILFFQKMIKKLILVFIFCLKNVLSDNYTASLLEDLLKDYDNVVRPVETSNDILKVYLGIKLSQIADIDERNQIMTTNVWVRHVIRNLI